MSVENLRTYPFRYRLAIVVALCHLVLMALGATYTGYSWAGRIAPALDYYGSLSGAGNAYGFFAPGISRQLRAIFTVTDREGRSRDVRLETGASHEADLRVGNAIDQFEEDDFDTVQLQRSLSSSLAGTVFERYPDARLVAVRLEQFEPISMSDYRAGARPRWKPVYEAKFALSHDKEAP